MTTFKRHSRPRNAPQPAAKTGPRNVGKTGAQLAAEGASRAIRGADPLWCGQALDAIQWAATNGQTITADDVWDRLTARGALTTANPSALGTLMKRDAWRRFGWISPVEEWQPSRRPDRHRAPVRVWRSAIYAPARPVLPGLAELVSDAGL